MAKNDSDLFDRLRQAGVRKRVAKTLSGIGEGASKQAVRAAQSAVSELRSVADEIERRLPIASRSRAATASQGRRAQRPAGNRRSPAAPAPRPPLRLGRMVLARLEVRTRPRSWRRSRLAQTASEIAKETGIGTGTVGSTLSKMATTGEVQKADRGYGLPK